MELVDINKIKQQCMIDLDSLHTAKEEGWLSEHGKGRMEALEGIMDFIENVQPTKEVDLEKEIEKYLDVNNIEYGFQVKLFDFARHFYELGLKVQKK